MQTIPSLETNRLRLVSLSVECLRFLLEGDYRAAQEAGGVTISADCSLIGQNWIGHRLRMIEEDPSQHPWMYRAIVRKSDNTMVGHISFHHKAPDPDLVEYSPLAAELGYTIEPPHRRQGYATESARAMMQWAQDQHGVANFILSISPQNIPSLKMAESLHFQKVSERMDDHDGLEFVFQATLGEVTSFPMTDPGITEEGH